MLAPEKEHQNHLNKFTIFTEVTFNGTKKRYLIRYLFFCSKPSIKPAPSHTTLLRHG
jgi:hypothetical protein